MKNLCLLALAVISAMSLSAQTFIGNSSNPYATAHHNQRKIVRDSFDNVYVVYVDGVGLNRVIKGVVYNSSGGAWSYPVVITNGTNPTLAIEPDNQIHLIYQTNNSVSAIKHSSSPDLLVWSEPETISDSSYKSFLPVADFDAENLHIFWVQENSDLTQSVVYGRVEADTLAERKVITTKNQINDVAVACHLMYLDYKVFFAIQFDEDSLQFFMSEDYLQTIDTLHQAIGSQPCITYNSAYSYPPDNYAVRFLYINPSLDLIEAEINSYFGYQGSRVMRNSVKFVCIDDILPMTGYSYLFIDDISFMENTIYHAFSYGSDAGMFGDYIMETVNGPDLNNPSIAYKHFNPLFVDFIWMQGYGGYDIFHMRDEKHQYMPAVEEVKHEDGFSFTGYPNPFSKEITMHVNTGVYTGNPRITIFDIKTRTVAELEHISETGSEYLFNWNGYNSSGEMVEPGVYLVLCNAGKKKYAWKVLFKP